MIDIVTIEVTPLVQNARLLISRDSNRCVIVDPGGDAESILQEIEARGLSVESIWLTHSHLDHCGGVAPIKAALEVPLIGHPEESYMRGHVVDIARMYGIPDGIMENCPEPDYAVSGGEVLEFAGYSFKVLFTPGHSPGHVCFYGEELGILLAGDTLFSGSIGRTDLPGGSYETLMSSLHEVILLLPPSTRVLPGHGPETSIEIEKRTNPFLKGSSYG